MAANAQVKNNESVNKSMLMKAAWALVKKSEAKSFSDALKQAWKAIKLKMAMSKGVVMFQYRKVSGEVRTAYGTLKSTLTNYEAKGTNRKPCYSTVAYWDVQCNGFRSFCISNLI